MVVVGPWAPRPAGGAGQPLLASLLCIDFCCSALPWRLLAGGDESSAHPPHLPLSWLGWPSLPTMPQLWLAPVGSSGPLYTAPGPQDEGSQRAHGDPQLCSPALGSPASNHLLELLLSFSPSIIPPTLLLFFLLHCLLLLFLLHTNNQRQRRRKKNKLILTFSIVPTLNVNPAL